MDVLFVERITFKVSTYVAMSCRIRASREEVLRKLMEHVGIELIDYGAFTTGPYMPSPAFAPAAQFEQVDVFSKAAVEKLKRSPNAV